MTNETNTAPLEQENPQNFDAPKGNKITAKIHLACAAKGIRNRLEFVYFKGVFAYATNGVIAVKVDLTPFFQVEPSLLDLLDGKILHRDQFALVLGNDIVDVTDESITIITKKDVRIEMLFHNHSEISDDGSTQLLSYSIDDLIDRTTTSPNEFDGSQIGVNADALKKIADSMLPKGCSSMLRLKFRGAERGIIVFPADSGMEDLTGNSIGIIMPFLLDK